MIETLAAGDLSTRLIIEKNTPVDGGQKTDSWATWEKRWAKVTPRGGREAWRFKQLREEIDHVVLLRFDSKTETLNAKDFRFKIGSRILNIGAAFDPDSRRHTMETHCTEVVP